MVLTALLLSLISCASINADIDARFSAIDKSIGDIRTQIGDITTTIGGGSDSIALWIAITLLAAVGFGDNVWRVWGNHRGRRGVIDRRKRPGNE